MRIMLGTALALGLAAAVQGAALAGDAKQGDIEVKAAWARATPAGAKTGAAFMTVLNSAAGEDRLVSARSPVAKSTEVHLHVPDGDVMRMRAVKGVDLFPGQAVEFAPGGLHVMFLGLQQPLKQGDHFPLTLKFLHAGEVTVTVDVAAAGASGAATGAGQGMHDPAMHDQHMADPAAKAMHEQHMQDPAHRAMHEQMHGKQQ